MKYAQTKPASLWAGVLVVLIALVGGIGIHAIYAEGVITAAFEGRSIGILNDLLSKHRNSKAVPPTLDFYLRRADGLLGVYVLAVLWLALAVWTAGSRDRVKSGLRDFFLKPTSPMSLGVFRIALFGFVLKLQKACRI